MSKTFTIVVPHYDGTISDQVFLRGMKCIKDQTFKDFEVLIYHDGPLSRPLPRFSLANTNFYATDKRYNDWGHSLRDFGIRQAKGEYILHFNPDNILYPDALQVIYEKSQAQIDFLTNNWIIVFPIMMVGMQTNGKFLWRTTDTNDSSRLIFTGFPTERNNVDCMQVVVKRQIWLAHGGWYDKSEQSDGNIYPSLVKQYGARYCNKILGEHR